jgi:hypothetical protein
MTSESYDTNRMIHTRPCFILTALFRTWINLVSQKNGIVLVRFEVVMAVIMKNAVFSDIKSQFIPHRRHNTSPLQSLRG